jgi:hypothetical protein
MVVMVASLFAAEALASLSATEVLSLLAGDAAAGDNLGWSVDVDGDRAVLGAIGDDDAGSSSGSAYVFFNDPTLGWVQEEKLVMPGAAAGDRFGESVGIQGNVIVVGASNDNASEPTNYKGSAWVFTRDSMTGDWDSGVELAPVTSGLSYGNYGISVAIDNATIVVGASFDNQMGISAGAAHVFELSGSSWNHTAELLPPSGAQQNFGTSVAIDADTIVIGAPHWTAAGLGAAFAYNRADGFSSREALPTSDNSSGDQLGRSIAVSGDLVVVGAPYDDDPTNGDEAGSITIIDRSSGDWLVDEKLTASDGGATDHFGNSVALDGTTIAIGAPWTDGSFPNHGSFYLFALGGAGWSEDVNTMSPTAGANLGHSIALDLPTLLVGAHGVFPGGEGVVYEVSGAGGGTVVAGTAICGDVAHYAWIFDTSAGNQNIAYRNCNIGGVCSSTMTLVGAPTVEANPAVACDGDTVVVMWEDHREGNSDLAYRRSVDGGTTFGSLQFLVKGPSDEAQPTLAMSGGVAVAVWEDHRNGNIDLASRRSNDGGASWSPLTFLVRSPLDDKDPVVDLDGSEALMAWVDERLSCEGKYRREGPDAGGGRNDDDYRLVGSEVRERGSGLSSIHRQRRELCGLDLPGESPFRRFATLHPIRRIPRPPHVGGRTQRQQEHLVSSQRRRRGQLRRNGPAGVGAHRRVWPRL